ncbi:TPA: TraR/DksA family transcriptional regulator [Klebsiella aerogenes]|nr:TraR/DksA family transcriptional regulator [Klebsiella aerogenes]
MTAEIIDQANEIAQQRIDMAIAAHRINHNAISAEHCEDCGDPIPEKECRQRPFSSYCEQLHDCICNDVPVRSR